MNLGLDSPPRLIDLRPDDNNDREGAHDRERVRKDGGGFLVPGECVHGDVINASSELIRLVIELIGEHFG